jgi:hypothetical protein
MLTENSGLSRFDASGNILGFGKEGVPEIYAERAGSQGNRYVHVFQFPPCSPHIPADIFKDVQVAPDTSQTLDFEGDFQICFCDLVVNF